MKIGPSLELQPLSILNLRVAAEYMYLFSTFGFLQSFASARDDYSDPLMAACASADPDPRKLPLYRWTRRGAARQRRTSQLPDRRSSRDGQSHGSAQAWPGLRNRLSPGILVHGSARWRSRLFDVTLDTLVPARGWVLANDLDLAWMFKFGLMAGVRYSVVQPFYSGNDLRPGEFVDFVHNGVQRIGPILSYTFFDRGFVRFNKPTILLISGFYVSHRYRAGQEPAAVFRV